MRHKVIVVTPGRKRSIFLRLGIGVFYSERNGHEVLRWEAHWTKISGIWVNTPWGCWWVRFCRFRIA